MENNDSHSHNEGYFSIGIEQLCEERSTKDCMWTPDTGSLTKTASTHDVLIEQMQALRQDNPEGELEFHYISGQQDAINIQPEEIPPGMTYKASYYNYIDAVHQSLSERNPADLYAREYFRSQSALGIPTISTPKPANPATNNGAMASTQSSSVAPSNSAPETTQAASNDAGKSKSWVSRFWPQSSKNPTPSTPAPVKIGMQEKLKNDLLALPMSEFKKTIGNEATVRKSGDIGLQKDWLIKSMDYLRIKRNMMHGNKKPSRLKN